MVCRIRIVMSVLCIIACVALMIIWVRSYHAADRLHGRFWGQQSFVIASKQGRMALVRHRWGGPPDAWLWEVLSFPASVGRSFPIGNVRIYETVFGFGVIQRPLMVGPPFMPQKPIEPVTVEYVSDLDIIVLRGRGFTPLNGTGVIVPFWFLVLVTATSAAALQMRWPWRYSLRGLLLTFAFTAVLLGLITNLDRASIPAPIPDDNFPDTPENVIERIKVFDASPNR